MSKYSEPEPIDNPSSTHSLEPIRMAFAGHRGFGASQIQSQRDDERLRFPENSLISLQEVIRSGAEFIEFDLYLSQDQHLMVIHDDDLSINAHYIVQRENEVPNGNGGHVPAGETIRVNPNSVFVSQSSADALRERFDISKDLPIPSDCPPKAQYLYKRIPEFHEVLELVSVENAKRRKQGLPRVKLNVELKGVGTGAFVQKAIEDFNSTKDEIHQIRQDEIYYMSFLDGELATIAGLRQGNKDNAAPNANLILGVPTNVQYIKVGPNYAIEDPTLNMDALKERVENLHFYLQRLPGRRGKGLTGVDMSLWDVGDDSIKYFCGKLKTPIHIAIVPFEEHDLSGDEISRALNNVSKIAASQGRYLGSDETMIIKTDNPTLLREMLEGFNKSIESEITSVVIMKHGSVRPARNEEINLFPKPGTTREDIPVADNSWWGDLQLISALQLTVGDDNVLLPVVDKKGLKTQLKQATGDGLFIIPMNVNVIAGELVSNRANHWVGLHIVNDRGVTQVDYVDPMGRIINDLVSDIVIDILGVDNINSPLEGRAIQANRELMDNNGRVVEVTGNTNDCGPMLVYAMDCIANGNRQLPEANLNTLESRELGQNIRRHFAGEGIVAQAVQEDRSQDIIARVQRISENISPNVLVGNNTTHAKIQGPQPTPNAKKHKGNEWEL